MSEREYAKHRGCARSSVLEARANGRLSKSVSRDSKGRLRIDAELADLEWELNTDGTRVPFAIRDRKLAAAVAEVAERLAELAAEVQDDVLEVLREKHIPATVRAAAAELTEDGAPPTAEALAEVLDLASGLDGRALQLVCDLIDLAEDAPPDELERAKRVGREAARGAAS